MIRGYRCLFAIAATVSLPALAQAQQQDAQPPLPEAGISEIVVTAQKRAESLQRVSASIQVLGQQEISKVSEARDITSITPGVQIGMGGAAAQIYVRGVGDNSNNAASNPGVSVNMDGVYIARAASIGGAFYDLERIEILKGPQGTLYGRNSSGGAINLIARKPMLGSTEGYVEAKGGNYDLMSANGALNVPVGSDVAIRAAFNVVSRDGYTKAGSDDDHQRDFRLSALMNLGTDAKLLVGGDYSKITGHGSAFVPLPGSIGFTPGMNPWTDASEATVNNKLLAAYARDGACAPRAALTGAANPAFASLYAALPQGQCAAGFVSVFNPITPAFNHQNNEFWSVHAQLDWNLGFATLTVLPAYRSSDVDYTTVATDAPVVHIETSRMASVEARLSHDGDRAKWVAGVYYYNEDQTAPSIVNFGIANNILSEYFLSTKAYAAFGQTTIKLTDSLRLIAGLRYTVDKRGERDGRITAFQPDFSFLPPAICNPAQAFCIRYNGVHGQRTFEAATWKAGVEYDVAPNNMIYFTASTGFKAGGLQLFPTSATNLEAPSFQAEKLTAYELGSRNRFLNNTLQVNLELFHWGYTQHQGFAVIFDPTLNLPQLTITNDGDARIYGADLDVVAKLSPNNTLHFGGEYLNTKYTAGSLKGNPLPLSPEWSGTASFEHVFPLANGGDVAANVSTQFASSRWTSSDYALPYAHSGGYAKVDLSLAYHAPDDKWSLTAWARNLTNKAVYVQAISGAFTAGSYSGNIQAPRTFGGSVKVNF